ncbi:MAG: substrate-binding domain-containing protein [Planctomycetes bacterium]|nr:substrate-binding domain-containing protein [Planctomycetota bacterium]
MTPRRWLPFLVSFFAACGPTDPGATGAGPASGPANGPGGTPGGGANGPTAAPLVVAVIPKGTTHVFWKAVESGARDAERELGVTVEWKGPLAENDRAQQIQLVEQFVSRKVAGIAIAPLDHQALVAPIALATRAKLPVVIFDSDLDGTAGVDFASFVATDNLAGGKLGGEQLVELVGGSGKVVLLRYQVGSASTDARERGFLEAVKGKLEVLVDNRYAGATAGEAKDAALNLLERLKEANGIFCSNESATMGMLLALRQAGLAGKVRFVGFDASPPLVQALANGEIDALVVQNPKKMGYLATKTLVAAIRGEKVEPRIDTGVVVATRANMQDPAIAPLLQ